MIEATVLDSGLTVVTESMPDVRSVAIGFWVGTGSRHEDAAVAGVSHFLEHLLFKGTATRSALEIAESIDSVGGEMNAFTTKEYTAFHVHLLDSDFELGLDLLSDIFWSPAFRDDEIDAERRVISEELLMNEDEPGDLVHSLFAAAMFPDHPLGREILGERSTIARMNRSDIVQFFGRHYRPANVVVSLAGHVDHALAVEGVQRRMVGERTGVRPTVVQPSADVVALNVTTRPTEQAHIVLGARALNRYDEDRFALAVLDKIMGGGVSSRLFQEVREKRGLAYNVYSSFGSFQDCGLWSVYAGCSPDRVHEVLELINFEVDRVVESGITERELAVAKGNLRGSSVLGMEDSDSRMSRIARSQLLHGELLTVDQLLERVDVVTLEDVFRVSGRVLTNQRVLCVVGPFEASAFEASAFEGSGGES